MTLRRSFAIVAIPCALVMGLLIAAGSARSADRQPAPLAPLDEQSCFTNGSGQRFMQVCVSSDGNIVRFESPANSEHIALGTILEGYQLCDNFFTGKPVLHGYDLGFGESGFGTSNITQPNGPDTFPLTIRRTTTDGIYRLIQTFGRDTLEREFTVTMTLRNLSASPRSNVGLVRFLDGDVDNDSGDDIYDHSATSAWGRDAGSFRAFGFGALTSGSGITRGTSVESFSGRFNNPGMCGVADSSVPTAPGDFVGNVQYLFSSIGAGGSRTVEVVYRQF